VKQLMAKNEAKIKFIAETGEFNDAIKKSGEEMSKLKAELRLNETQMKHNGTTVEGLEKKHDLLQGELEASRDKVEALTNKIKSAKKYFGENSEEVSRLERQLANAKTEEVKIEHAISECNDEIKKQTSWFGRLSEAAGGTEEGFTVAKGAIADLASEAIQLAIGKVSEFITYLRELPEATREIRQDMATLDTSFENAGLTAEQATGTWKDLYTIFGEDDRAVEAANLIAKMSDNQQDLNDWVTITQGIWGSYQDSLPVEGLAEASMESAKTGEVTGVLADALNWSSEAASMFAKYMGDDVTTAEEAFNVALAECTTEQERQALITDTLTALYGDAAQQYEEASGAQLDAKEATAQNILVQNELADTIEPVTTAWQELKTDALEAILPVVESVSGAMTDALGWLKEHPAVLTAVCAAVGVLATALSGLAIAWGVYTVAQWAANSAILANPITWIIMGVIAAIAAVIVAIGFVVEYWEEIVTACSNAWTTVKETLGEWGEWINTNVIQPIVNFFTGLWTSIQNIWNQICNVVQVAVMFIGSIISAAVQIITLPFRLIWENCKQYVFAAWEWIKEKVTTAINAVKNVITTAWNAIKSATSTVWNAIKSVVSSVWNAIKSAATTVWNSIKNVVTTVWNGIKSGVSTAVNAVKSVVSSVFNSIKSTATSVWNGIKSAIVTPIEAAKTKVKAVIDAIKGFFSNLKLKLPNIKLPHFSIQGEFSLNPPSVPKLAIDWYKDGGIMTRPTIFGINGSSLMAGGEAGAEAILPIDRLEGYIAGAIEKTMNVVNLQSLADAVEDLANRPVQLNINGRQLAYATASDGDSVNGLRSSFKSRGLAIE